MSETESKEGFRPKCAVGVPCTWLERHLEDHGGSAKGMYVFEVVNGKTHGTRVVGIAYRLKRGTRPMMLNFCPWCGESIDWNEATKAAAESALAALAEADEGARR